MRSIGKRNIKLVKELVKKEYKAGNGLGRYEFNGVIDRVIEQIPEEVFDTWEMAEQEIDRIINDYIIELEDERGI